MTPDMFIASKASEAIKALYGADVEASALQVSVTRKEFEGDYTLVVFPLLRVSRSTPENTGKAIGEWLVANVPEISGFNCVKGFLNLLFSNIYWNELFSEIASDETFGYLPSTGRNVMIEFSSPNTNKPLHLGHIRNNLLGDSVSRLLKASGNNVIKTTLVNDRGVHICKSMLAWLKVGNGATPESSGKKGDHLVGDMYVAFNDIFTKEVEELVAGGMDKEQAKKEAPCLKEAHEMLQKWEAGDPEVRDLWARMNKWVLDGFDLGAGVLYPFVAKTDKEKELGRHSIGPVWDGNEVWLLTAGGALFAAFAPAYATTFSGFYLAIMLVLFGLILRAVSVEFASRDPEWARIWNTSKNWDSTV